MSICSIRIRSRNRDLIKISPFEKGDLERGASGMAEIFGIRDHLNLTMSVDSTRGALHEETVYGERLTPRGRAEKLPILSWVDPDFIAPIRSDEFMPLGKYLFKRFKNDA